MDLPDRQLLDRFASGRNEAAFRALVERHLDLVHGVARRVTASDDLARDVAQQTFVRLARRAALIPADLSLPVWLHRVTRHLAIDLVRAETRRKKREISTSSPHDAAMDPATPEPAWAALAPVIDQLVDALPAADREVLLARFYRNESHAAIAGRLGLSEVLARKRTSRALEKLRVLLGKKGIATTSMALATLLPAHAATPAPAALMTTVVSAAQGVAPFSPFGLAKNPVTMAAVQNLAIATAAIAFIASLGYAVAPPSASPVSAATSALAAHPPAYVSPSRSRFTRTLPATRAERLERLRAILAIENPPDRLREMIAFVDLLPPDLFAETAADVGSLQEGYAGGAEFKFLAATWTKSDPQAAADFAVTSPGIPGLNTVLRTWAAIDPAAALAWADAHPAGTGFNNRMISVATGIARHRPEEALRLIQALPDEPARTAAMKSLLRSMGDQPESLSRLIALVQDPALQDSLLADAAKVAALWDPARAYSMLKDHPRAIDAIDQGGLTPLFGQWAADDVEAAKSALGELPPGTPFFQALRGLCTGLVRSDPTAAFEVLRQHPGVLPDEEITRILSFGLESDPAASASAATLLSSDAAREKYWLEYLPRWKDLDPEAARRWMQSATLPESVRGQ
jgi:RNA polymerase sigma factor (sigma-70 family)